MRFKGEDLEEVRKFKHMGLNVSVGGEIESEVSNELSERARMM